MPAVHSPFGATTAQRKLLTPPESVALMHRLDDGLASLAIHRRDAILEAVAMSVSNCSAHPILSNHCRKSSSASARVHILKIDPTAIKQGRIADHYVCSAPGILTPTFFKNAKIAAMSDVGLKTCLQRLSAGEVVVGHVRGFDGNQPYHSLVAQQRLSSIDRKQRSPRFDRVDQMIIENLARFGVVPKQPSWN